MNCITILSKLIRINIKENYAIICCEVFSISLYLSHKIIHNSLCIPYLIHRKLKTNGTITFQHFRKVGTHLVIRYVITNNYHLKLKYWILFYRLTTHKTTIVLLNELEYVHFTSNQFIIKHSIIVSTLLIFQMIFLLYKSEIFL